MTKLDLGEDVADQGTESRCAIQPILLTVLLHPPLVFRPEVIHG